MAHQRFRELAEELLRAGVAPCHARRAVLEMESHFDHLIDEETARGSTADEALAKAHRRLGTNQELVRRYAARPELRAWSRRWPSMWFTIVPLLTYLVAGIAALIGFYLIVHYMKPDLQRIQLAPRVTREIDLTARIVLLWCMPLSVAAAFTHLALRRRMALRWPLICIVSLSVFASLSNVIVTITGGPDPGEIGAGIGISTASLSEQSLHAAVLIALSSVPLWMLHRAQRNQPVD